MRGKIWLLVSTGSAGGIVIYVKHWKGLDPVKVDAQPSSTMSAIKNAALIKANIRLTKKEASMVRLYRGDRVLSYQATVKSLGLPHERGTKLLQAFTISAGVCDFWCFWSCVVLSLHGTPRTTLRLSSGLLGGGGSKQVVKTTKKSEERIRVLKATVLSCQACGFAS